jgi:hypothetical protein
MSRSTARSRSRPLAGPYLALAAAIAAAALALMGGAIETPDALCRKKIEAAHDAGDHARVVKLVDEATEKKLDVRAAGDEAARSLMALNQFARAGRLLCDGTLVARSTAVLDQVGMGLQTAGSAQMDDGVCCLKKAVAMAPQDVHLNYDFGLLLWNSGHVDEAKAQCEKVMKLDPGNIQAAQILERIEKRTYGSRAATERHATRKVEFTIRLRKGITPCLAGSWNAELRYDQLGGWKREPMTPAGAEAGGLVTWKTEKTLATEDGPWYAALVSAHRQPFEPAMAFCRFPLYPYEPTPMKIDFDRHPVEDPMPLLAGRPRPRPRPARDRAPEPRLFLLCVDSATWNIFMPFMQAGMMPRLSEIAASGVMAEMRSDPPVSTIAFDILNFGTGGQFGLKDILAGGVELLKERGIDLLNYGGIKGRDHTWKVLATKGVPSLYSSWGEQLHYATGGAETVHQVRVDPDTVAVGGVRPPASRTEKVLPFLPEAERASFAGLAVSDNLIVDHYDLGVRKFAEGLALIRSTKARVALVHLGFVDIGYHAFWDAMDSDLAYLKPGATRSTRYSKVIEGQHRLLDALLFDMQTEFDLEHDSFILWSDHGATGGFAKTYYGHDPRAMLVMAGPLFKRGARLPAGRVDIADLAPTVFAALKLPCPPVYTGKPLVEALR